MTKSLDSKMPGIMELAKKELQVVDGGILPRKMWKGDYNAFLSIMLGPGVGNLYDLGYLIGKNY